MRACLPAAPAIDRNLPEIGTQTTRDQEIGAPAPATMEQHAMIVLVDANAEWRAAAATVLRESGYEVHACASLAGLTHDAPPVPDLLIVDVASIGAGGEVLGTLPRELRARFAGVALLLLSDVYDEQAIGGALAGGAADFLVRTTHWSLLIERVGRLCRMTRVQFELATSRDRLAKAHALAGVGTFDFDPRSSMLHGSAGSFAILGFDAMRAAVSAQEFMRLVPAEHHESLICAVDRAIREAAPVALELPLTGAGGRPMTIRVAAEPLRDADGRVTMLRGVIRDITDRQRAERDIERMLNADPLTGLPNRNAFLVSCATAIAGAQHGVYGVAVVVLDLDRFAQINESLGQVAGDEALCIVGERLEGDLAALCDGSGGIGVTGAAAGADPRGGAVLARLPGDRFAVLLPQVRDPAEVSAVVQALLRGFGRPLTLAGAECFVSCCAGVALYPRDGEAAGVLLARADAALVDAKRRGSQSVAWYVRPSDVHGRARLKLLNGLHKALERGELSLRYQPWVDVARGALGGVEALARWQHEGVSVPPVQFVALAEQSGLIVPIGEWAIREAARQMRAWRDAGVHVPKVAINISTIHFEQRSPARTAREAIGENHLEPGVLEIELTESCMVRDFDRTLQALHELRDLGVGLSLDDFGIGYSSLSYLTRLPIGKLKVDRSFVRMLGMSVEGEAVVRAIIALGRSLRLQLVAEGVETIAQARALLDSGCHAMQGYLFARPVRAAELPEAISRIPQRCGLVSGRAAPASPDHPEPACEGRP